MLVLKKVNSDNGHLWYAVDGDNKIVKVSMDEKYINMYINFRGQK